jgi:hypothetical protein
VDNSVLVDRLIREAIAEHRVLSLSLYDKPRIMEPHIYGIAKGERRLLAYQIAGESRSGDLPDWRWIRLSQAMDVTVLEQSFPGPRELPSESLDAWSEILSRVTR